MRFGISPSGRMVFQEGKEHQQTSGGVHVPRVCDMWSVVTGGQRGSARGTRDEVRKGKDSVVTASQKQ